MPHCPTRNVVAGLLGTAGTYNKNLNGTSVHLHTITMPLPVMYKGRLNDRNYLGL